MVIGFAKDNLHMPENELARLAVDIREGDMSVLLKEYEKEIKVKVELMLVHWTIILIIPIIEPFKKRHCGRFIANYSYSSSKD